MQAEGDLVSRAGKLGVGDADDFSGVAA